MKNVGTTNHQWEIPELMKLQIRNILLLVLMLAAAGMSIAMRPTQKIADQDEAVNLETMIPHSFGNWREEKQSSAIVIDPQQQETIEKIYSQTLSRTYVNNGGQRVMLSIAYGKEQSDELKVHRPEICYPAQGFLVVNSQLGMLKTEFGSIPIRTLMTSLNNRSEPVTYWITVGRKAVRSGLDAKLTQLSYGLSGEIPDGLLFRVSSLTQDPQAGYEIQANFVRTLIAVLPQDARSKLMGL